MNLLKAQECSDVDKIISTIAERLSKKNNPRWQLTPNQKIWLRQKLLTHIEESKSKEKAYSDTI